MRKIGINLHAAKGLTDGEYISQMAQLGFDACFSGVVEAECQVKIADLLAKYGIAYETLHAPFDGINAMWLEDESGAVMLSRLTAAVDNCKLAGVPVAVVHLSSGDNAPTITDVGRKRFESLVEHAARNGVKIAFENQRKLANLSWAMETFDSSVAGFCWDCGHESCFTPGREYMPLFGNRLICTHIHDNHGIYNGDDHMIPFEATKDFDRVAQHIRSSGYKGSLMLEVFSKDIPTEFLQRAAAAVKKLRVMVDGE